MFEYKSLVFFPCSEYSVACLHALKSVICTIIQIREHFSSNGQNKSPVEIWKPKLWLSNSNIAKAQLNKNNAPKRLKNYSSNFGFSMQFHTIEPIYTQNKISSEGIWSFSKSYLIMIRYDLI